MLQNLLANAIRHTAADGGVRIDARRSPRWLELSVEDTGEGIPPEDLKRIFDPFFRADPSRSGGSAGLGLVLMISRTVVNGAVVPSTSWTRTGRRTAMYGSQPTARRHLERVLRAYAAHHNGHRPHRGLQLKVPERSDGARRPENRGARLVRRDVLDGLIHEYEAAA